MKTIATVAISLLAAQSLMAANITYLNHFDKVGDFSADYGAAPAATVIGTPVTGAGFTGFGGGSQGMTLDYLTDYVNYAAVGNVTPTNGLSMGFWVSQSYDSIAAGNTQYYHYAGIEREDFPPGTDGINAEYSSGSSYYSEVSGYDIDTSPTGFYRGFSSGYHHLVPGQWLYYNIDYLAPTTGVPNSGHYRLRVYDDTGAILAGIGGNVTGIKLLSPGQQDAFNVLSNMEISIGAGTYGVNGVARQMTVDELAVWNSSLSESEVDAIVAGMVAGNPLAVPEPASAAACVLAGAAFMLRRRRQSAL